MKDAKDPGTIDMPIPRKRGRPTLHPDGKPLTPAMRAKLYRSRRFDRNSKILDDFGSASLSQLCKYLADVANRTEEGECLNLKHELAAEIRRRCPKP